MKLKKMIYPICAALLLVCAACNALNGSAVSELPSAGPGLSAASELPSAGPGLSAVSELPSAGPGLSAASEPPAAGLELPDAEPELPAVPFLTRRPHSALYPGKTAPAPLFFSAPLQNP